jgi:hypothetical protein
MVKFPPREFFFLPLKTVEDGSLNYGKYHIIIASMPPKRTREAETEQPSKKKKTNFQWTPEQTAELVSLRGQNRSWSDIASKYLS